MVGLKMNIKRLVGFVLVAGAVALLATPVHAIFSGSGSAPSCSSKKSISACRATSGCYWSTRSKKCRRSSQDRESREADDRVFFEARALIEDKQYTKALELLRTIKNQNQPRVLNYIGFSTRKLGDVDKGISYYHKALALDPDYVVAREYLGEGYLQKGDLAGAEGQLREIFARDCKVGCEAYDDLAEAILNYKAGIMPKAKN